MFQDPYASLDPRMRVGTIIREPLKVNRVGDQAAQQEKVRSLLDEVGLSRAAVERYPHEFSGGQRQRIGLARALALDPKLIVADEPVSALDVSIQAQILNLMKDLQARHGLTYLMISHDLAVVRYMADTIGVMYLGKVVELGPAAAVYERSAHHYTMGLLNAVPVADVADGPGAGRPVGCGSRASCPRRCSRRRAAGSTPAVRPCSRAASTRSPSCRTSATATWPPATSRCRPRWPCRPPGAPPSD